MHRQGRILIVDDVQKWREELVETLQRGGFYAEAVASIAEALHALDTSLYHLLILDIRMQETDQNNKEGINLLGELEKRGLSEAIKIVMLSAHGTPEYMHRAFRGHGVLDFLMKERFDSQVFLDKVYGYFANEMQINLDLDVHWGRNQHVEQIVRDLEVGGERINRNSSMLSSMIVELDDLFCRLFHEAKSILLEPLPSGRSGAGVLRVQPFFTAGGGHPVVVKFGDFRKIEIERRNFKGHVQPFVGGGRNTTIIEVQRTLRLEGIVYSLLGASDEPLESFESFYRRADIALIRTVLDRLFFDTCKAWYINLGNLQLYDLAVDYQHSLATSASLDEQAMPDPLADIQKHPLLSFKTLNSDRCFHNPLLAVANSTFVRPTYVCTTHGDFNQHNLLVDETGYTWLIDFQSTGRSHFLRDVTMLDSVVRFQLLSSQEATLSERLEMEEVLCGIKRFSHLEHLIEVLKTENPFVKNPFVAKAYATVLHLRMLAQRIRPSGDMSEYSIALLYNALNTIHYSSLSSEQKEHALLCASLLSDQLELNS